MRRLMLALVPLAALVAAGCGGASDSSSDATAAKPAGGGKQTLSLVAYSTPQVVYDEVIPAFQKTAAGNGVAFKTSYGPSGDQSRAVESGLPADVVTFSLEPDLDRLIKSGQVAKTAADRWVTTSVVTFIVRKGNPKHIRTWDDLLKPGVQVVTPNPFTSGAAKWNLLAAYGAKGLGYVRALVGGHDFFGGGPQAKFDLAAQGHQTIWLPDSLRAVLDTLQPGLDSTLADDARRGLLIDDSALVETLATENRPARYGSVSTQRLAPDAPFSTVGWIDLFFGPVHPDSSTQWGRHHSGETLFFHLRMFLVSKSPGWVVDVALYDGSWLSARRAQLRPLIRSIEQGRGCEAIRTVAVHGS